MIANAICVMLRDLGCLCWFVGWAVLFWGLKDSTKIVTYKETK